MINSFLKFKNNKQNGAITLIISSILLVALTLIILFAASYNIMQEKIASNQYRNNQAFTAAEAGLEFGIQYLQSNSATILAGPVGGFIPAYSDSNTTNIALSNGSKFSVVYTNPIANNYNLILIKSTGKNADGTSTSVVQQQVQFGSTILSPPNIALVSKGSVSISGNGEINNTITNKTVSSASTVSLSGNAETNTSTGGSSPGNIRSDIQQNVTTIANQSQSDFFATYFGIPSNTVKSNIVHYYSNNSSTSYNTALNGMTGTSIWIDQTSGTASLGGNVTLGSSANPVLLIVNGSFSVSGNVTIYGFLFVIGATGITTLSGNNTFIGGMVSSDNITISGNSELTYSSTVLSNLQKLVNLIYYAKVPGTWKDF